MLKIMRQQLKLMFHRWGFWLGLTIVLCIVMLNSVMAAYINKNLDITQQQASVYICLLREGAPLQSVFLHVYPFLLMLPFSFSYRKDSRLHIQPILMNRMGVKRYYAVNMAACFTGSFLIFFIPLLLGEVVNSVLFQNPVYLSLSYNDLAHVTGENIGIETVQNAVPFTELYFYHPHIYNFVYIIWFSVFAGILSLLIYSISSWIKKYDVILLVPIYLLTQIQREIDLLIENSGYIYFNVNMNAYISIDTYAGQSFLYLGVLCAVILGIIVLSTFIKCRMDQLD